MRWLLTVDDYGWTSEESEKPPMKKRDVGLRIARKFHETLNGIPYVAGIIPAEVDAEGLEWIRSNPHNMFVALHGYDHSDPTGDRNEFKGMSESEVRQKVDAGQRVIGPTPYWIPTYNGLNPDQVAAMHHEGIRYIFGREQHWPSPPSTVEMDRGVVFVPRWKCLYGAFGWVQGGANQRLLDEMVDRCEQPGVAVMTIHLPWESARDPEFRHAAVVGKVWRDYFITPEQFIAEIR